ncbi:MAG: type II secretion system F family protein [Planctomycetia bacterium]|nr:type II secretion system F family protein [Planctomycetia bacterium]
MFSKQLPLAALIEHCRATRHMLETGLTLPQVMSHQAKSGPAAMKPVAKRLAASLKAGESLQDALEEEKEYFPPLYLSLGAVAEETGNLPEVLRELEHFFSMQLSLWKKFVAQITWPCIQFVLATLVVTLLIWLLGILGDGKHGMSVFGLQGSKGAAIFFFGVWGFVLAIFVGIYVLRNVVGRGPLIDGMALKLYALGPTLEALALARFSLGMSVTQEAGVAPETGIKLALESTSNHAYIARVVPAQSMLKSGETLADTLREQHIFPEVFVDVVHTAEVSGKEPETFARQAKQYSEIAEARLKILATAAYWLVWLMVAIFIIVLIFNIFSQYVSALSGIG